MCFSLFLAYALKTKMIQVTIWVSSEVFVLALFKNLLISSEICMQKKKKKESFISFFFYPLYLPPFFHSLKSAKFRSYMSQGQSSFWGGLFSLL